MLNIVIIIYVPHVVEELLAVCKELLQEMKKGNASGSNKVPPAKMPTRRGKAKVLAEYSVSCLRSTQTPKCRGYPLLAYVCFKTSHVYLINTHTHTH